MIKKLTKHHYKEYKEIRLDALKKSPDSFLSSFEEENKISDNAWAKQLDTSIIFGYLLTIKLLAVQDY